MKTTHILLAGFVLLVVAGLLPAQQPAGMPNDIQELLQPMEGDWVWDGGKVSWRWSPGKNCMIGQFSLPDDTPRGVSVLGWDAEKKQIVDIGFHQGGMHTIRYSSFSPTKWSGTSKGVTADGEKTTAAVTVERGTDMFKVLLTKQTIDGKPTDDLQATVRRVKK